MFIGGATDRRLVARLLRRRELFLQRREIACRRCDPTEKVAVIPAELIVLRVERGEVGIEAGDLIVEVGDLGFGIVQPQVGDVRADDLGLDGVENREGRRLRRIALLHRLDVVEDGALAPGYVEEFTRLDQWIDLLECVGDACDARGFVEHELAYELCESANALERLGLSEQLLCGIRAADTDQRVQGRQILALSRTALPAAVAEPGGAVAIRGPLVAGVDDVDVTVVDEVRAMGIGEFACAKPLQHQSGDGCARRRGVGDGDRRPGWAASAEIHDLAVCSRCVATLAPRTTHVLADGASTAGRTGRGGIARSIEVATVIRQEGQRNRVQQ